MAHDNEPTPGALDHHLASRLDRAPVLHLHPAELYLDSPIQQRSDYPEADHLALVASLETNGQINEATARRSVVDGRKVIELIAGFRRARAIMDPSCSLERLRVKVLDALTDDEAEQIRMHENLNRTAPTHYDRAEDAHRLVHRVFRGSRRAVAEAALQMNCDHRTVRRYLELHSACAESPTLRRAAQRQGFKMALVRVWLEQRGPLLDRFEPGSPEEQADHTLRMKAVETLFRHAAPERAVDGEASSRAVTVNTFGARLSELVAALPGQPPVDPPDPNDVPLLTRMRSGLMRLRSVTVDPSTPLESRAQLREQLLNTFPTLFGANEAELETVRTSMLEVVETIENEIDGYRMARQAELRYRKRRRRRPKASTRSETERPD